MAWEASVLRALDHSVGSIWFTNTSPSLAACHTRDKQGVISIRAAECSGIRRQHQGAQARTAEQGEGPRWLALDRVA